MDTKECAPVLLRVGIGLVLLWFGFVNTFTPDKLGGYIPTQLSEIIPFSASTFMIINGVVELILAIALIVGYFTRLAALIASLHIAGIGISLGYNDIMIRDLGLAIAAYAVFLHGPDKYTVEK